MRSGDGRFAAGYTFGNHIFLNTRQFGKVNFYPHIAAGYHDTVGNGENFIQIIHAFTVFDFGNDTNIGIVLVEYFAQVTHIIGGTDKAGCDKVKALFDAEENIFLVFFTDIWHRKPDTRNIYAFVVFHHAIVQYPTANGSVGSVQYHHTHQPVIQENAVPRFYIVGESGISNGALTGIALYIVGVQCKNGIGFQQY